MTEHEDQDLTPVDVAAHAASEGLHAHVASRVSTEVALAALPAVHPPRSRGRFLAVAAVFALLVGSAAVLDDQDGDGRSRLEVDEDGNPLPVPQPGTLTPLGPRDGKDSIGLPVTVEPHVGLEDGDTVTATSPGFVPGEQVGIVQCAREAGGETREARGGIDGCNIGSVVYADADADGVATGRFKVRRVLTTPLTGTVDCSLEADRCIVAMGAISDYDRSGGLGIAFAPGGEPVDIPILEVEPATGLHDRDTVRLRGSGFNPNDVLSLSICSSDPSACWQTHGETHSFGVQVDGDGRIEDEVAVYRFLPGAQAGTYVDCAVSRCSLRASGENGAPPVRLEFVHDDAKPVPPAIAVDPSTDLATGDTVVVRGAGFDPGAQVTISLCVSPTPDPVEWPACSGSGEPAVADEDGTFAVEFELPDIGDFGEPVVDGGAVTTACGPPGCGDARSLGCGGGQGACAIVAESYSEQEVVGGPVFHPVPVPVTFR